MFYKNNSGERLHMTEDMRKITYLTGEDFNEEISTKYQAIICLNPTMGNKIEFEGEVFSGEEFKSKTEAIRDFPRLRERANSYLEYNGYKKEEK